MLSGCVFIPSIAGVPEPPYVTPPAPTATPDEPSTAPETEAPILESESQTPEAGAACDFGDYTCAMQEHGRFMDEQQLPTDGSPLVAVTPEQQQFVSEQRSHVESQGGTWTPQDESIILALTADACEAAILSFHEPTAIVLNTHVASSPLFQELIPEELSEDERLQAEASMADIMIYGMQYLCPDDFSGWAAVFAEVYPDY